MDCLENPADYEIVANLQKLDDVITELGDAYDMQKKLDHDIIVERASLEKMASSSDKVDKTRVYYEKALQTADGKRQQMDDEIRILKMQLVDESDVEEVVFSSMEATLEARAQQQIAKLLKQIELIKDGLEIDKQNIRSSDSSDAIKKEKMKNKIIEEKIRKLEAESKRQEDRVKTCLEDMQRMNIEPLSKRLATLEEKKKQLDNKVIELKATMKDLHAKEMLIHAKRAKEQEAADRRERAKQEALSPPRPPPKQYTLQQREDISSSFIDRFLKDSATSSILPPSCQEIEN
jgi:chromosome segregation ATPase